MSVVNKDRTIRWYDVDANCKKKVAERLYNKAQADFGQVIITQVQFTALYTEVIGEINEVIDDFYKTIGVTCEDVSETDLRNFYTGSVAPII